MSNNSKAQVPKALGIVTEALPNTMFRVRLDKSEESDGEILTHLSGKMRLNRIRVLVGDKVEIELDQYGGKANRITRRF